MKLRTARFASRTVAGSTDTGSQMSLLVRLASVRPSQDGVPVAGVLERSARKLTPTINHLPIMESANYGHQQLASKS